MSGCCVKVGAYFDPGAPALCRALIFRNIFNQVYTLEKVLKIKKDTVTQTVFLDEAIKVR
jgi:hypothetical protein